MMIAVRTNQERSIMEQWFWSTLQSTVAILDGAGVFEYFR